MQEIRRSFLWLGLAWAAAVALLLIADVVVARAQSESRSGTVEEIVVTAEKREESLQETALSVTAIDGAFLNQTNFQNVNDIREYVPNLNMHSNTGGNTGTTVSIRGAITGDPIITFEPAVGIYMDGLYISKTKGSLFDAPDLERIEVLRGPQGTLYGRNTIGGAINLIPNKPGEDPYAEVTLGVGNFDSFKAIAVLDSGLYEIGPNAELGRLGLRGSIAYRTRDGYFDNIPAEGVGLGDLGSTSFDDMDRFASRLITRWEVTDQLTLDYTFEYFRSRENTTAFQLSGVRPNIPGPNGETTSAVGLLSPVFGTLRGATPEQFIRTTRVNGIGNNRILTFAGVGIEGYDGRESVALGNPLDVRLHNITATYDFGDLGPLQDLTLKSISGWRNLDLQENQDLDGSPLHIADFQLQADQDQFSQELNLIGGALDGMFDYVLGFYYFEEDGSENNPQVVLGDINFATTAFESFNGFDNTSIAPYGQITLRPPVLDERLALTAGLRYTYEKKRASRVYQCLTPDTLDPCLGFTGSASESFQELSPMANVAFDITDEFLGYFRFAQGFKSGGFNGRAPLRDREQAEELGLVNPDGSIVDDLPLFEDPFPEERMTSYELGFKSEWLENRLQVNAAGFYQTIGNKQVSDFVAGTAIGAVTFVRTGDQEFWGSEIEAVAVPTPGLNLRLAYALLLANYTELNVTGEGKTADNASVPNAPEHTVSFGFAYTPEPFQYGVLTIAANAYWQDNEDFLLFANDFIAQGDYWLLNGRIQVAELPAPSGTFELALWGRNLLDQKYRIFGIDFNTLGYAGNTYGAPRTFGADLTWRWGADLS